MRIVAALLLAMCGCHGREIAALSSRVDSISMRVEQLEASKQEPEARTANAADPERGIVAEFAARVENDPDLAGYPRMLGIPMTRIIGPNGHIIDPIGLAKMIRAVYARRPSNAFDMLCMSYGAKLGAAIYYGRIK